jgi:hypothetical protein
MKITQWIKSFFTSPTTAIIPGPTITLGTKVYTIAPLNFATLKKITPLLTSFKAIGKNPSTEDYDNMVKVIWYALQRNHPRISLKEVEEGLDISNINSITATTMGAGGGMTAGGATADNQ